MIPALLFSAILLAAPAAMPHAPAAKARATAPAKPFPSDAACTALAPVRPPFAFAPGELLEFDLDALGAQAGKLTLAVHAIKSGELPVQASAQTNTFFANIRRVSGGGTSYVDPRTLKPSHYVEDTLENEIHREAKVTFHQDAHSAHIEWKQNGKPGPATEYHFPRDGLDTVGAIYLLRQQPWAKGRSICFDAYAIRRMWRVSGTVTAREHVSLPIGEFDAWHLQGEAVRLDNPSMRREIHLWITDDAKRLPLAAVGVIDLGAVRATLVRYERPWEHERAKAARKETLKF